MRATSALSNKPAPRSTRPAFNRGAFPVLKKTSCPLDAHDHTKRRSRDTRICSAEIVHEGRASKFYRSMRSGEKTRLYMDQKARLYMDVNFSSTESGDMMFVTTWDG